MLEPGTIVRNQGGTPMLGIVADAKLTIVQARSTSLVVQWQDGTLCEEHPGDIDIVLPPVICDPQAGQSFWGELHDRDAAKKGW